MVQSSDGSSSTEELGSGVIVDSQGAILTVLHVVAGETTIMSPSPRHNLAGIDQVFGSER